MPNLKAEMVPNANPIAEYTAADVVNTKIPDDDKGLMLGWVGQAQCLLIANH